MTTFRRQLELHAGPLVLLLARLPRFVPFAVVLALLVGGLLAQGVLGGALLLVLAALLGTLLTFGWLALDPQARAIRTAVVALVVVRAVLFIV